MIGNLLETQKVHPDWSLSLVVYSVPISTLQRLIIMRDFSLTNQSTFVQTLRKKYPIFKGQGIKEDEKSD